MSESRRSAACAKVKTKSQSQDQSQDQNKSQSQASAAGRMRVTTRRIRAPPPYDTRTPLSRGAAPPETPRQQETRNPAQTQDQRQRKGALRALTRTSGRPSPVTRPPPRGCPRCHKAGTAGITHSTGKGRPAARTPGAAAAHPPHSPAIVNHGAVRPSRSRKHHPTCGGVAGGSPFHAR